MKEIGEHEQPGKKNRSKIALIDVAKKRDGW